jgi:putative membrane protein
VRFRSRHDNPTLQVLTRCIQEVEARTEAEVVLVIRRASGMYRDIDYLIGALAALAVLLFELFSEYEFDPLAFPVPLILAFIVAARLSQASGRYGPRRYLTSRKRRETQVRHAAAGVYHDKKVDGLSSRSGILLYFSALEQHAELLAGDRARAALGDRFEELRSALQSACSGERTVRGSVDRLAEFLRTLGVLLGQVLPCGATGHKSDIDDTPDLEGEEP